MAWVNYEKRDRVGYITLNRPAVLNALDDETNGELWEIWNSFSADDSVDVAILTGEGRAFCAGADLKTFFLKWENATVLDLRRNIATGGFGGGITRGQHRMTKPIIAAVNGHAIGGGFEIALACDIRIASEKARFASFETRLGLHQGDGGIVRLVAIAGMATAMELALTGREVSAEEALHLGLVSCVVPHHQLMATADRYASMILKNSQRAVRSAKETILDVVGRTIDDALRLETINAYSCLGDFTETRERLDQFYAKKK
jgi:enoyl-CoA hydratase